MDSTNRSRPVCQDLSSYVAIGRDVTTQVKAAETLAAAEAQYRSLVERLPDVIWSGNNEGKIVFVTENGERISGFSGEEIRATTLDQLFERTHQAFTGSASSQCRSVPND